MPGSRLQLPYTPPEWLTNEQPDDPYWLQVARRAAKLVGVGDPVGIGMGLPGAALETGAVDATGQLIKGPLTKLSEVVRRGLYSRLDDYAALIGKGGVSPARLAKIVSKDSALAEEAAFRKVPQLIEAGGGAKVTQKTIPLSQVQAHLQAHPAPTPTVVTKGGTTPWSPELEHAWNEGEFGQLGTRPSTPADWMEAAGRLERVAQQWQRHGDTAQANRYFTLSEEAHGLAEGLDLGTGSTAGQPKFATYQVPGGEAYRETLLTLPQTELKKQGRYKVQVRNASGQVMWEDTNLPSSSVDLVRDRYRGTHTVTAEEVATPVEGYRSGHFDEPNIVVHTRANERTLPTGERGRFIEEVQSDWHQAGKKQGYQGEDLAQLREEAARLQEQFRNGYGPGVRDANGNVDPALHEQLQTQLRAADERFRAAERAVPDAPFKETWPDLGLKQQVLEAAADPEAQWIGHTAGATQAARYDLSKQIGKLEYNPDTHALSAYDLNGAEVIWQTVPPDKLGDHIGKEAANKLLATPRVPTPSGHTTLHQLEGLDLQVGGEGMHEFYDKLLPARLQKILRPFGGTVERGPLLGPEFPAPVTAGDRAAAAARLRNKVPDGSHEAWFARLTPEMKARILKEGLPLSVLLGLIPLSQVGKLPQEPR